jgi:dynein heavy chain
MYVKEYIVSSLGQRFIESLPFNLNAAFGDSTSSTPIIFVLSVGADPMRYLLDLAREHDKFPTGMTIVSLG